ncbi:hypothetical protein [Spirillospora sp. CA-128828]|uniref:hypothetical protein n=1 Tax=Spirillospora sp. CA-128828 TaxID=3240033 RepID=UPI003D8CF391
MLEMLDPETTAIITGAAGNLVAYMLNGQVDAVRSWVGRIFRGGSEEDQATSLRIVEEDLTSLTQRAVSEVEVRARWGALLAAYLAEHPEIRADLEGMAKSTFMTTETMNVGEQHNYGSGSFIGRDNYGEIATTGES